MLMDAGANLRCIDNEQSTPLHHACAEGNMEMVQAFFDVGCRSQEADTMIFSVCTSSTLLFMNITSAVAFIIILLDYFVC